jgi:hypothetical protein
MLFENEDKLAEADEATINAIAGKMVLPKMGAQLRSQWNAARAKKAEASQDSAMRSKLDQARQQAQGIGSSFKPLQAEAMPTASTNPQFQQARLQLTQRANAANQQNQDALKRRFASIGSLNSGAAVKTMQNAQQASDQQREEAIQNINAAEANDLRQEQDAARGRNFQREMSNNEREFQSKIYSADAAAKFSQMDIMLEEFFVNRESTKKNFEIQKQQAENSGGLFGGGGFLGLGL